MKEGYLHFYTLSYFNMNTQTTISQILHVFHGKRTPSMFFLIEVNGWHHGFSMFKKMTREQLTHIIESLEDQGFIAAENKGYILTERGHKQYQNYFNDHYFPKYIKNFIHSNIRIPFWNRWQLLTQVFSELSYSNARYVPVVKHPHHQENVRQLFNRFDSNRDQLLKQWVIEQHFIFEHLEESFRELLLNQFTGHQWIGKTREQMAEFYGMEVQEFTFYLLDAVERSLQFIESNREELSLHQAILAILHEETNWGLSASTFVTYQMLREGAKIAQVAQQRSIKENTVKEHILEIAFTFNHFSYRKFIPKNIYEQLQTYFETKSDFTYKEAMDSIDGLEFMHYRLVELERMRAK
ncbi:MAG TPA: helix-turn-helix domain-containing protein [Atopostipes sp.]|nr:helix-turn-helix domain-containing protein [Atopostipes sp.]